MSTPQIILLIVGLAFIFLSFLLVERPKAGKGQSSSLGDNLNYELSEEEKNKIRRQVQAVIEQEMSDRIFDAEDKLNQLSNEKIMAVNEFSTGVLEKIEINNSEVVFLFQMLNEKEEELKSTFSKMETVRKDVKELLDKLSILMAERDKITTVTTNSEEHFESAEEKLKALEEAESMDFVHMEKSAKKSERTDTNLLVKKHKDEIINLYKKQYSIRDISKQLGLGQGEVKLVLDLYAN
ncbi:DUF6115 domain-containing protein [Lachnoclostridium phytofermentans]|uniref:Uncharacterized protein n=1 Tax=Lachnoclostridium phytofermentans (strain ATCC 700394 / DSM 18823 / ISDg) TaxID=357809 RepID=A9KNC6_LACP7|nr:DUF6115 domain-containing protein [Lachnoclostridium phytofermentans]ABX43043.1 hypothetical protein Cphy_2682 [Lachnoclostridium phytofermentans ISDg]